jgi:hypothetical protein
VDYQFQGIALGNTGGGLVLSLGSVIDAVTYPAGTAGTAWACGVVDHDANDGDTHWYAATTTYGSGDRGTPGIANETMVYGTCSLAGVDAAARVPAFLGRPQPNPSRRGAWVPYRCEARAGATIRVFDGAGRNCRTLALDRGRGTAFWDFADDAGHRVAAGVYWLHAIGFGVDLAPVRVVVLPGN